MSDLTKQQTQTELAQRAKVLTSALALLGWELTSFELDLVRETARVDLRRGDRKVIMIAPGPDRAVIERFRVVEEHVTIGRRGDRSIARRLRDEFLWRSRSGGFRAGLRELCYYIAENSTPALPSAAVRALFAPMLAPYGGAAIVVHSGD